MAITYGLSDAGFTIKPLTVIRSELNNALREVFGPSITANDRSILGIIIGIFSERISLLWETLETIASSQDPNKATGTLLDAIASLTGTFREPSSRSTVTLTLTGDDGTTVSASSRVQTVGGKNFVTLADVTIVAVESWSDGNDYDIGARVFNVAGVYQCIQAGQSESAGTGPTGTGESITDGTCLWTFLGLGDSVVDSDAEAEDDGPIVGAARDISVITTEITGWQNVINLEDALPGRLVATDAELRLQREIEIAAAGSSPFEALLAELARVDGVTSVKLFANSTDVTDADGVPPHSVECLVRGGDDQAIFNQLLNSVAAGIGTFGNTTGSAADSQGTAQTESFSRAVDVPIFVKVTVTKDVTLYPSDGDVRVKNAMIDFVGVQEAGRDAVNKALASRAFTVQGVLDVPQVLLFTDAIGAVTVWSASTPYVATSGSRSVVSNDGGRTYICITPGTSAGSGGPTGTGTDITDGTAHWRFLENNIVINTRQRATLSSAHINVTSSSGTL